MDTFEICGENASISIRIDEVFENSSNRITDFRVQIKIEINSYSVNSHFYISLFELRNFHAKLVACQSSLNGIAVFDSREDNLELEVIYNNGKANISGKYQEYLGVDNILEFDFLSDQSYLKKSVDQLDAILQNYC
ncbi:hypothetical protein [uncultured Winogradskyella sp.]|uniref:WapI family immunity protein n=1 Tax=uncultured Winogradskyella sp. TaxID=395353 RepID=UPI002633A418|nr:hypothetical protein [uncultured Winogradskyella sp.]